jgi:hypothetical protein
MLSHPILNPKLNCKDSVCTKYATTSFHFIVWMLIFDIVPINRNAAVLQGYENNRCISTTKLLRSCM